MTDRTERPTAAPDNDTAGEGQKSMSKGAQS